jgi:hypothetical protein
MPALDTCIVAAAGTGPPLPLPFTPGSKEQSDRQPGAPLTRPVFRECRSLEAVDKVTEPLLLLAICETRSGNSKLSSGGGVQGVAIRIVHPDARLAPIDIRLNQLVD